MYRSSNSGSSWSQSNNGLVDAYNTPYLNILSVAVANDGTVYVGVNDQPKEVYGRRSEVVQRLLAQTCAPLRFLQNIVQFNPQIFYSL
jgi:hypothetical protein